MVVVLVQVPEQASLSSWWIEGGEKTCKEHLPLLLPACLDQIDGYQTTARHEQESIDEGGGVEREGGPVTKVTSVKLLKGQIFFKVVEVVAPAASFSLHASLLVNLAVLVERGYLVFRSTLF